MSNPNEQLPYSNYLCHNCGTRNSNGTVCIQCHSDFLEELPQQTLNTEQNSNLELPLIHQFQNLFNNDFNLQTFTNILLPRLMSQIQPNLSQHRHRHGRPSRRIKRVAYRYLPSSFHTPRLFNTQLIIFDPNEDNFQSEMFTQLINEDMDLIPHTTNDINQLPTLTMTPSNLLINPSCAICLESFDPLSEVKQLPICHHIFHTNCLTEWLIQHNNCPMCRTNISSIQQRPNSVFNNHWLQQLLFQTFGSQQMNLSYPSVKAINSPQTSSNPIESDHLSTPSSDTPQLPHFDSSSNLE